MLAIRAFRHLLLAFVITSGIVPAWGANYDVVVYGGTSAGVTAAIQTARMGKSVALVCPETHLGGLTTSGLGFTDSGKKEVIGGLAREFYSRLWQHYQSPAAWKWQDRKKYGNRGQGTPAIDGNNRTMWMFEPHVAEQVLEAWLAEFKIDVFRDCWLDRANGVAMNEKRIQQIKTLDHKQFEAQVFIDATYEGDLMAAAGVRYHVGRESNATYGEKFNGAQHNVFHHKHYFSKPVDPFVIPGDAASGLLPRIMPYPTEKQGEGDHRLQAYCYRMCLTDVPNNRVPFAKPAGYDPQQYELLARLLAVEPDVVLLKNDFGPNRKTDTNNNGPFSTDNIGYNYAYPEATYEVRRKILIEHQQYQQGYLYFLANDPSVPAAVREKISKLGLAADEFTDNGNWPYQIYVRECRRMIGMRVMTEADCRSQRTLDDSIGMGSYIMDSHNVQRYVTPDGKVQNEGDIGVGLKKPYQISYQCIVPKEDECQNLVVPVCLSASHIAYGSIRMEPVFMILGQSAATAAVLSIDNRQSLQEVEYAKLKQKLLDDQQVLEFATKSAP